MVLLLIINLDEDKLTLNSQRTYTTEGFLLKIFWRFLLNFIVICMYLNLPKAELSVLLLLVGLKALLPAPLVYFRMSV